MPSPANSDAELDENNSSGDGESSDDEVLFEQPFVGGKRYMDDLPLYDRL